MRVVVLSTLLLAAVCLASAQDADTTTVASHTIDGLNPGPVVFKTTSHKPTPFNGMHPGPVVLHTTASPVARRRKRVVVPIGAPGTYPVGTYYPGENNGGAVVGRRRRRQPQPGGPQHHFGPGPVRRPGQGPYFHPHAPGLHGAPPPLPPSGSGAPPPPPSDSGSGASPQFPPVLGPAGIGLGPGPVILETTTAQDDASSTRRHLQFGPGPVVLKTTTRRPYLGVGPVIIKTTTDAGSNSSPIGGNNFPTTTVGPIGDDVSTTTVGDDVSTTTMGDVSTTTVDDASTTTVGSSNAVARRRRRRRHIPFGPGPVQLHTTRRPYLGVGPVVLKTTTTTA